MNINPIPSSIAASIAGSDRAATTHLANTSKSENLALNSTVSESVDSIDKGNSAEDKDADGKQTLDTFERQRREQEQPQSTVSTQPIDELNGFKVASVVASRLDFKA